MESRSNCANTAVLWPCSGTRLHTLLPVLPTVCESVPHDYYEQSVRLNYEDMTHLQLILFCSSFDTIGLLFLACCIFQGIGLGEVCGVMTVWQIKLILVGFYRTMHVVLARIFAGVPWKEGVIQQWGNRKRVFSGFRTLPIRHLRKWGQYYYTVLFSPLSPFHWPQNTCLE